MPIRYRLMEQAAELRWNQVLVVDRDHRLPPSMFRTWHSRAQASVLSTTSVTCFLAKLCTSATALPAIIVADPCSTVSDRFFSSSRIRHATLPKMTTGLAL